jgi:transcriptional regulator with XRE-family HTH domain
LTRFDVAKATRLAHSYYNRLEAGTVPNPSWLVVQALADYFGVSTEEFREPKRRRSGGGVST